MSCLFCDIAAGRAPGAIVHRWPGVTAFLDVHPLFKGHVLVVPDLHVPTLVDAPPELLAPLLAATQ